MANKRILYPAILLGGFSTLATVLLVAGNLVTRDAIQERQREDLLVSLRQVVPAALYSNDLLADPLQLPSPDGVPVTVYRGIQDHRVSALAYQVSSQGYAGEIRLILGLDATGKVLGVRVLSHSETPGLGDGIELAKSDWILDFNGLSLGNPPREQWRVKKDGGRFDAFSGATITPRAVVTAIENGLLFFQQHQTRLLVSPGIRSVDVARTGDAPHE
ncbi:electron transport complex subunit RsxG [Sedimenticola sp.]|uniref:electron transport complex subunit RsxG n=1 Tax=Sedimenticola sp. TaxID=1940285 RepID=UPI003D104E7A